MQSKLIKKIPKLEWENKNHTEYHTTTLTETINRTIGSYLLNQTEISSTFIENPDMYHDTAEDALDQYADTINRQLQPSINKWLNRTDTKPNQTTIFAMAQEPDELVGYGAIIENGALRLYATNVASLALRHTPNRDAQYQAETAFPNITEQPKNFHYVEDHTRALITDIDLKAEIMKTATYQNTKDFDTKRKLLNLVRKPPDKSHEKGTEENKNILREEFKKYYNREKQKEIERTKQSKLRPKPVSKPQHVPLPTNEEIEAREQYFRQQKQNEKQLE